MISKKICLALMCGGALVIVAGEFEDTIAAVENFIAQKYPTKRAQSSANGKLDKIIENQQLSEAEKITALKKEFPGAFSVAPAPIKDNSLIYVPVVSYKIHSLSIGYDLQESASSQTKTVDIVKQVSEASAAHERSKGKSLVSQHQVGVGVDAKLETTLNPLRWLKDAFLSDTGSSLKVSAKYQYDRNATSNASELWSAKQQELFQRNHEQIRTLLSSTEISKRHLTFTVTLYNGSAKTFECDLTKAALPVYMGNQSCNKMAIPYDMSGGQITLFPGMTKDITFRMELNTTTALELVRFMSSSAPTIKLERGTLPIQSTDGAIPNAIAAASTNAPVTFPLVLSIPGHTAEWQIRHTNADGKKTTLREALNEIQEMFLRKTGRELFAFAADRSLEKVSGCQTTFNIDSDFVIGIKKGAQYIDQLSAKELDDPADLDGYQIRILAEQQLQEELLEGQDVSFKKFVFEKVKTIAERGNAEAQSGLAELYLEGIGVEKDAEKAFEWGRKSAEQGNAEAQVGLAALYLEGIGVEKDAEKAFEWGRKSAEQGNAEAQLLLAGLYLEGIGVEKDAEKAFEWYRKSAEQGNAEAQWSLAGLYLEGIGVEKDAEKAFEWYRKSAEQGNAEAQWSLANLYFDGTGVEKDVRKAFEWCRKSAEQGDAVAQLSLANLYFDGIGVEKDVRKAFEWYRKSAEQGDAVAQLSLANLYFDGTGVEKDAEKAFEWYRKSAEQGNAEAQLSLGVCYLNGFGVRKNRAEGIKWLQKAAEQGNERAEEILSQLN
ncbi:MAG: SEL1-like repeat protein [Victivallaceae bacterium]|nr:SEL1-like repeat protein [Victivallaceae bacterium]